jgi:hypothetical protein
LHPPLAYGWLTPPYDQQGARYLNGEAMPQEVFIQALDIVAGSSRSQP